MRLAQPTLEILAILAVASPVLAQAPSCSAPNQYAAVGVNFSTDVLVNGTNGALTWTAVLPPGVTAALAIDSPSGTPDFQLSGIPRQAGTFASSVQFTDAHGTSGTCNFTLYIAPLLTISSPAQLPSANAGLPYTYTFTATEAFVSGISLINGTLPSGLSFTGGTMSGTPTVAGNYSFTLGFAGRSALNTSLVTSNATKQFSLTVGDAVAITTPQGFGETWVGSTPGVVQVLGGVPPYQWSLMSGNIPGIALSSSGNWTGSITTPGIYSITVRVADSQGASASQSLTVVAAAAPLQLLQRNFRNARVGLPYIEYVPAAGGIPPYRFTPRSLPGSFTLDPASGLISGTFSAPSILGTASFYAGVTDSDGQSIKNQGYTITLYAPKLLASGSVLPPGLVDSPYEAGLPIPTGPPPYRWQTNNLPAGLALEPHTGVIYGSPAAVGSRTIGIRLIDGAGTVTISKYSLVIVANSITLPTNLPSGVAQTAYSTMLDAKGGYPPYTYRWMSTVPGLTITGATISGTPTTQGIYSIPVQVLDSQGTTANLKLSLTIYSSSASTLLLTTPNILPVVYQSTAYSSAVTATGGSPPYSFGLSNGSQLPQGLTLDADGTITGNVPILPASQGQPWTFSYQATDSTGFSVQGSAGFYLAQSAISIVPGTLPAGTMGIPYLQTLTLSGGVSSGGTPAFTYQVTPSGNLPDGIGITNGSSVLPDGSTSYFVTLGGTPRAAGMFNFDLIISDGFTTPIQRAYTVTVGASDLSIAMPEPPLGIAGQAYTYALAATGQPPYEWSLNGGSLPPGLTLNSNGQISGTASASGTFVASVQVRDASGGTAVTELTLEIDPGGLAIAPSTLPQATAGAIYYAAFTVSGGTSDYTFVYPPPPPGLQFTNNMGLVGVPTTAGTFSLPIQVTDELGQTVTQTLSLTVVPSLSVTAPVLPVAIVARPYHETLTATQGAPPYLWTVVSGTLPSGLRVTPAGYLVGVPVATGTFSAGVLVTDSNGDSVSEIIAITVQLAPPVVTTGGALAVTGTTATLTGTANPNGGASHVWFEISTNSAMSNSVQTAPQRGGAGLTSAPFSAAITGLSPGTLYYFQAVALNGGGTSKGAVVSFTTEAPGLLTISVKHSGVFHQGQTIATYTVTVSNDSAGGAAAGAVVTETLPAGLTLVSMSGSGWSCSANKCTRNDILDPAASYPPITVTVSVTSTAPSQVTNQVTVSGHGSASNRASDLTYIVGAPTEQEFISSVITAIAQESLSVGQPSHPLIFSGNLVFASGAAILNSPAGLLIEYVDGLKAAGAQRIDINPGVTSINNAAATAQYDAIVHHTHVLGLQLALNPVVVPGELGATPTFQDFQNAALNTYPRLAARYQPDNFVIVHEPTTVAAQLGIPISVADWDGFIRTVAPLIKAASPRTRIGAGGFYSAAEYACYQDFVTIPALDFMTMDIYEDDHFTQDIQWVQMAHAAVDPAHPSGKGFYIEETWAPYDLPDQLPPNWQSHSPEDFALVGASNADFSAIDISWLQLMTQFASANGMEAITAYTTDAFFEYGTAGADKLSEATYSTAVELAIQQGQLTATGQAFLAATKQWGAKQAVSLSSASFATLPTVFDATCGTASNPCNASTMVAPGALVSAFGADLATASAVTSSATFPTTLGGTTMSILDSSNATYPVPMYSVSPQQVNYSVPGQAAAGPAEITITSGDGTQTTGMVLVSPVAPGLYTANENGQGPAAAIAVCAGACAGWSNRQANGHYIQDTFVTGCAPGNCTAQPISLGATTDTVVVELYGTGFRHVSSASAITASINGQSLPVLYAGPQGQYTGLDQVNVQIPHGLAGSGLVNLTLNVQDNVYKISAPFNVVTLDIQ